MRKICTRPFCFFLLTVCLLRIQPLALHSPHTTAAQQSPPLTQTGQRLERELQGGEEHRYPLRLASGDYVNVAVVSQGLAPQLLLLDAQGQSLAFGRFVRDVSSAPELAFLAPAAGEYQLVLRVAGPASKAGKYTLTVNALGVATEQDRHYATAHQLSQAGVELIYKRTAEGRRQGLAMMLEALSNWRASGALPAELEAMRTIADTHFVLGEFHPALAMARELLAKAQSAGLRRWELTGLKYVGALHNSLNDYASAQQTLEQALPLSRELRERLEERAILNSLGLP
jgi:tetratricopeptide (TPR) repeat protein